jgi:predicted enzyme related to lactoylglutathione lyase
VNAELDSIVISTTDPDRLRDWYAPALDTTTDDQGLLIVGEQRLLFFPHDEIHGPAREPARIMINLRVNDADAAAKHLDTIGVTWIRPLDDAPFGRIGTIADPDGNYLQLVQLAYTR